MATTANRGWRLPDLAFPPNVPADIQNLGSDIDADITKLQQAKQMQRTTSVNILDNTATGLVSWPNPGYSVGSIVYNGSGIFTIGVAGLYRWELTVTWPGTTTTHTRQMFLYQNGAATAANEGRNSWTYFGTVSSSLPLTTGGVISLAANDTVQAVLQHNAGSTLSVSPTNFSLVRIA